VSIREKRGAKISILRGETSVADLS